MKGIGLSGVAGAGKRELGIVYAEESDFEKTMFSRENMLRGTRTKFTTTRTVKEYGNVLDSLEAIYSMAPTRFITDLTPVDIIAELYATFCWYKTPNKDVEKQVRYLLAEASRICSKYLSVVMHIQPAMGTNAIDEHLNALTAGLIHTRLVNEAASHFITIRRSMIEPKHRLLALRNHMWDLFEVESPYRTPSKAHH